MKVDFTVESYLDSETMPCNINNTGAVMVPKTFHFARLAMRSISVNQPAFSLLCFGCRMQTIAGTKIVALAVNPTHLSVTCPRHTDRAEVEYLYFDGLEWLLTYQRRWLIARTPL